MAAIRFLLSSCSARCSRSFATQAISVPLGENKEYVYATHQVKNQPTALEDFNMFLSDVALRECVGREGDWAVPSLTKFGSVTGSAEMLKHGYLANKFAPILQTHDRFGHRIDEVEFHPSYHTLMSAGMEHQVHSMAWNNSSNPGAFIGRCAQMYLLYQTESGVCCPLTMTFAGVPVLKRYPEFTKDYLPKLLSTKYDQRHIPVQEKEGITMGMAMTEKQGGSDVRANTTRAVPIGNLKGIGADYYLTGHKWFCSAPMCDIFLTLAQTDKGLSCFLVPRFLPDGTKNRFFIQRLKDKVGNRSNASSEIEYNQTWARMIGEEGRGVATILEMVHHTRLDCAIGAASAMRWGVSLATHHTSRRLAFGKFLKDQPLMKNVLADLIVESEAATVSVMRLAKSFDQSSQDEGQKAFSRITTAIIKYWLCKRVPNHSYEVMEAHGGSGYVEENPTARLYREAPLNSIWEGSGNVSALDVLRAMSKEPNSVAAFQQELQQAVGYDKRLDNLLESLKKDLNNKNDIELRARKLVQDMAIALQATLLVRNGHPAIAEAFLSSRIVEYGGTASGLSYGTLPTSIQFDDIIERATPKIK